jgi:hypothetical protein
MLNNGHIYRCHVKYRVVVKNKIKEGTVSFNAKNKDLKASDKSLIAGISKMYEISLEHVTILEITYEKINV